MRNKTMAVTAINILASYVKRDKPKTMQEKKKHTTLKSFHSVPARISNLSTVS